MAVKKDITPGMVIAKRDIYGYPLKIRHTKMNLMHYIGFLLDMDDDVSLYNVSRHSFKNTHSLVFNPKNEDTHGVIVTDDMVPILRKIGVNLLPVDNAYFLEKLDNSFGFFSTTYTKKKTESRRMILKNIKSSYHTHASSRFAEVEQQFVMPLDAEIYSMNLYIAPGLQLVFHRGQGDFFPDVEVDKIIRGYESQLNNNDYITLLNDSNTLIS